MALKGKKNVLTGKKVAPFPPKFQVLFFFNVNNFTLLMRDSNQCKVPFGRGNWSYVL